jgi:quercetin dioxygenase-like cupin family protein
MKKYLMLMGSGIFFLFLFSNPMSAQVIKKTDAKMNHVLVDTSYVRAMEVSIEPGQKTDIHTHPAHFFYALTEGKLKVTYSDCGEEIFDIKKGDSGFSMPERPHYTENISKKPIKFLLVELKEHPYMSKMMN